MLRYALDDAIETPNIGKRPLVLSFFFHDRGVELQRTPLGLFRSLLYQLLRYAPDALSGLVSTFQDRCSNRGEPGENWHWNLNELQGFFESSLQQVLKSRPVWLLVDALDESGKDNARDLIWRFESWLQMSPSKAEFRICFTCRHYPILRLSHPNSYEICLEHENKQDIVTYLQAQFSRRTRSSLPDTIQETILARAEGVFMWTRLVVKRAFDLEDEGVGWKKIQKEIERLPPELHDLYQDLVESMDERLESYKLIQWICFALQPLSLDALRWAILIDADSSNTSLKQYSAADDYVCNSAMMERRLKALSRGLAETVPSSKGPPVVQFIHQSVKDFFVDKGLLALYSSLDSATGNTDEVDMEGIAHHQLSRTCIRYLAVEEIAQSGLLPTKNRETRFGLEDAFMSTFPLLSYAKASWIVHVQQSEKRGVSQEDLLDCLGWPSEDVVRTWVGVQRITRTNSFDPPFGTSLLHIVSQHQLMGPLRMILQSAHRVNVDAMDSLNQTPLMLAAIHGHEVAIDLLLERGANANVIGGYYSDALQAASHRGREEIVRVLLKYGPGMQVRGLDLFGPCTPSSFERGPRANSTYGSRERGPRDSPGRPLRRYPAES